MALVKCPECKSEISSEAKICPKCGIKPVKKKSLFTWLVSLVFLVVVFKTCSGIEERKASSRDVSTISGVAVTPVPIPVSWSYETSNDQMTSKPTKYATLKSLNSLALERPYAGENYGQLTIRKKTDRAEEVMVSIDKGQSMCRSYSNDCTVSVRFDDAQPIRFAGQTPSDGSSTTIFLTPAGKFIAASKKAKTTKVSLEIYQAGNQILEFSTATPLNWP